MGVWDGLGNAEAQVKLLLHPAHASLRTEISRLVASVQAADDREALRPVQERLAAVLAEAEGRYGQARKRQKRRVEDGSDVAFWRSTLRRLRAVGDAIAWKFLAYRRQWLLLMGRNQHPGLMTGKGGFDDEWQLFQAIGSEAKRPSLPR